RRVGGVDRVARAVRLELVAHPELLGLVSWLLGGGPRRPLGGGGSPPRRGDGGGVALGGGDRPGRVVNRVLVRRQLRLRHVAVERGADPRPTDAPQRLAHIHPARGRARRPPPRPPPS